MTDKEDLGASIFGRSLDLMEDDPLEEIFALNMGDFISEYLISEDLANKISKIILFVYLDLVPRMNTLFIIQ